ncbi:DNRLRE domain-containing protein [Chitinophaga sp. Cy-1792]|uniref:CBM96 family carbohydrate-binding protein n=1 Tax=Chitinophaga sp. Cy-1792 TaxID=2608339 RepID=UPI0014239FAC|nr:DNRLRE domain-containing protein [Chitinophaga sp. Cy-1792]NIG53855.1 DNRLRE domain-containing protein [Chitinophaga sp. Cy-1792]
MRKTLSIITVACVCLAACAKQEPLQKLTQSKSAVTGAGGTVYYVDPAGSDTSAGTSTTAAWQSIAKVNSMTFSPGDQILFKSGGVWNDTLHPKGSGIAGAPIVIDKYGGSTLPIINGGGAQNGSITVLLDKVSYWTVNNLEITNTVPTGVTYAVTGIRVNGGAVSTDPFNSNITISNCYVHNVNAATVNQTNYAKGSGGIIINGMLSDVLVQSCHIANCSVEGLRTTGATDMASRLKNIIFDNNLIENIYGDGIVMSSVSGGSKVTNNTVYKACMTMDANFAGIWTIASTGTLVAHNEVYGMTGGGANDGEAFDADGYTTATVTDGDIFEYNYTHDNNGGFMLFMGYSKNITVRYNVSINDIGTLGSQTKKLFWFEKSGNNNRQIYNNVFVIKNPANSLLAVYNGSGAATANFSNNIIYTTSTIGNFSNVAMTNTMQFNNNCLYPSGVFSGASYGTAVLSNNFYDNPLFTNPATGNGFSVASGYNVADTSRCRNAGILISSNGGVDFAGNTLPAGNPDVGAFQHAVIVQAGSSLGDSYVRDGSYANANYGTDSFLVVKADATSYARKSYLKFSFTPVTTRNVSKAILSIYCAGTTITNTVNVYGTTTNSWLENTLTWNNAPMDTTLQGQVSITAAGTYNIDVTKAVNAALLSGSKTVSLLLMNTGANNSNGYMTFNSKEASNNQPVLQLQY